MGPESKLQAQILKRLRALGFWAYKPPQGPYSRIGVPDLLCCIKKRDPVSGYEFGVFVAIEVKAPDGRVSKLQAKEIEAIKAAGGYATVIRSVEELERFIELFS